MKQIKKSGGTLLKVFGAVVLIVVVVAVLFFGGWALMRGSVAVYSDVAPRQAEAERNVYVNTPSYVLGKQDILNKYRDEYLRSKDEDRKSVLRMTILSEASTVDRAKLSPDLQAFLNTL